MKTKIKKIILSSAVIVMFITAADFNQGPVDKSPVEKYSRVKFRMNRSDYQSGRTRKTKEFGT